MKFKNNQKFDFAKLHYFCTFKNQQIFICLLIHAALSFKNAIICIISSFLGFLQIVILKRNLLPYNSFSSKMYRS